MTKNQHTRKPRITVKISEEENQKKAIRNAPGKGEDIERHVVTLRNRQSKDGNCAYCSRLGHGPWTIIF